MSSPATTSTPPYYAVIFTSVSTDFSDGYQEMANRMLELANEQPGFLGVESARADIGITVSYWKDKESIKAWKKHTEHIQAQQSGRQQWYSAYTTRIALVEQEYSFDSLPTG